MLIPLFSYAGGKRRSLNKGLSGYLKQTETYVEPFFGAGAVFCYMVNRMYAKKYIINDSNAEIVGVYRAIRDNCDDFCEEFFNLIDRYKMLSPGQQERMFVDCQDSVRNSYNAAMMLFVLKSDHGSIPKFYENGKSNRSSGHRRSPNRRLVINKEQVKSWSAVLQHVDIHLGDFELIPSSFDNALVFCDPPYYSSRIGYGSFTKDDQLRCLNWCNKLAENRNVSVLLSNRDYRKFFSKRVGSNVEVKTYDIVYSAGENARQSEALFIWNSK